MILVSREREIAGAIIDLLEEFIEDNYPFLRKVLNTPKGDSIFYELCFCLLTPQSNAKKCDKAIKLLKEKDFLNKNLNPVKYLKTNTRFHNKKAKYLIELKESFPSIKLERDYLVKNIKGIGLKEASHFLRNIGYKDLAILDRHILKNLKKYL